MESCSLTQGMKAGEMYSHYVLSFSDGRNLRQKYYKEYFGKQLA